MPQVKKLRDKRRTKTRALTGKGKILSPKTVEVVQLRYNVLKMREEGWTIRDIAESLGETEAVVSKALRDCLTHTIQDTNESAEEHRQMELDRYDGLLRVYWPMAIAGNLAATAVVMQLSNMRRKLLALDVPEVKKLDITGIREYVGVDLEKV